jgi:hypothetical protein
MHERLMFLAGLAAAGLLLGFLASAPLPLRRLRSLNMVLFPVLLCSLFSACTNWGPGFGDKALALVLFLASCLGLIRALTPTASWFHHLHGQDTLLRLDARPIDEDIHIEPVKNLMHEEKFEAACTRLEGLLKNYRADFDSLLLLAQLSNQLKKRKQAEECLLLMLRIAPTDEQQLSTLRLYHELAAA